MLWGILTLTTGYLAGFPAIEFLQSKEFLLPFAVMATILSSAGAGWWIKSIAAGHREAKLRKLFGDGTEMTKIARRRRQEDQLYEAITSLVYKKVMSSREAKRLFRVLAEKAGLEGLRIPEKEYKKLHAYQMMKLHDKTTAAIAKLQAEGPVPLPVEEPKKSSVVRTFVTRVKTRIAA